MNSMIEYIRQINQTSVTLKSEWLERLRHVDVGSDAGSLLPEIVLAEPGERKIPKYKEGNWEPPITEVSQSEKKVPGTPPQATTQPITTEVVHAETSIDTTDDTASIQVNDTYVQTFSTADVTVSTADVTDSVGNVQSSTENPTCPPQHVDPMAETKISEPSDAADLSSLASLIDQSPESLVQSDIQSISTTNLDKPAVLDGILRPTIMPLRPNVTTDVLVGEPSSPVQIENTSAIDNMETAESTKDLPEPNNQHPPSQIIEIINGLEGTSFEALTQQDTVPRQEWVEFKSAGQSDPQSTPAKEPEDVTSEADIPVVEDQPTPEEIPLKNKAIEEATDFGGPLVSFPSDNRAERFHFAQTKKQKLVNSITDQIVERFPIDTPSTIMIVAAKREIDVDGAASKIATCLATRELGDILLVDGNLYSRQLTTVLGLVHQPGFADACAINGDANDSISPTDNPNLKTLGAGTTDILSSSDSCPSPTTTHSSLRQAFDYSIISGGVAGDPLTDAWAGIVDGVYLLVDMDQSDRHETSSAVDYLRQLGARLVGCIAIR